jgi:hypothetical protein
MGGGCICPLRCSVHNNFVRDGRFSETERGWECTPPHPHQPGLIFSSWRNVRQQKWPLPLCTLCFAFDRDEINCSCAVKVGQPPTKANLQCSVQWLSTSYTFAVVKEHSRRVEAFLVLRCVWVMYCRLRFCLCVYTYTEKYSPPPPADTQTEQNTDNLAPTREQQ